MATLETRGFVSKFEQKQSAAGKDYCKFVLSVQQKRKDKNGQEVKDKLYVQCVDFTGSLPPGLHADDRGGQTAYVGVKGYLTVTSWAKDGKNGTNLDVTVTGYEALEQKESAAKPAAATPPADPFALNEPAAAVK